MIEMSIMMILKTSFIWIFTIVCHQQKVIVSGTSAKLSVKREKYETVCLGSEIVC